MSSEKPARGAVFTAPETIEIREFPHPSIGPEDMLVKVRLAGVDGSDIHMLRGELAAFNDLAPVIMGDEIVGEVVEIGDKAAAERGLSIGDRVIVEAKWSCQSCDPCQGGQYYACEKGIAGRMYGWINCEDPPHLWGSYATHVFVPAEPRVHAVPDAFSDEEALLAGSVLANGYRWTGLSDVGLDTSVVIIGPGPQGLACTLFSDLRNASEIVVVGLERDAPRLQKASDFGADETIAISPDETVPDTADRIGQVVSGGNPEVVIETAGTQAAVDLSVSLVKPTGTLTHVSVTEEPKISIELNTLLTREVDILNPLAHPYSVRDTLEITADELAEARDIKSLVSHTFPLAEAETALRTAAYEYEERPLKVAIAPD